MNRLLSPALLGAALLLGCGSEPLVYLKVDEPSLVITQSLPAVPGAPAVDVPSVSLPPGGLDLDIGDVTIDQSASRSRLDLNRAALVMLSPPAGTDFSGLKTASLVITPPAGSDLPQVVVASFDAVRDGAAGTTLTLLPGDKVNLLPYLAAHKLHVEVVAAGSPPGPLGSTWTADLSLDFHLLAMVGYPN